MKPFVTAVRDYHEFDEVKYHFANAGIKLKYEEVGCGFSHVWKGPVYAGYHAVFYQNKKTAAKLIKVWKSFFESRDCLLNIHKK